MGLFERPARVQYVEGIKGQVTVPEDATGTDDSADRVLGMSYPQTYDGSDIESGHPPPLV